ncbi:DUF2271 domain-containing protein [uncultured Marinobacter sp.]|uniref:DUF2271 domain-containing protein n=1 Tax=uncultured Marinobacter sp. TaxID=187379 RepID=UPI0030DB4E3A
MKRPSLVPLIAAVGLLSQGAVTATEVSLELEIPQLPVAEYHRPYVAVWLENDQGRHLADFALWYDLKLRNNEGTSWLKDMRLWWRRSGRQLSFPVDGFTGATRAPGVHQVALANAGQVLAELEPGQYRIMIEAAREVGGRELVELAFAWPVASARTVTGQGEYELGDVRLQLKP